MKSILVIASTQLDAKECWKKWMGLGSLRLAKDWFAEQGRYGVNTGKPHNHTAIEKAAFRWLTDKNNWGEARQDFNYYFSLYGKVPTDDDWHNFLWTAINHTYQNKKTLRKWIEENGVAHLAKQYLDNVVLARMGLI